MITLALQILFTNPCDPTPLLETKLRTQESRTVGQVTIDTLESFEAPYVGSEQGLNSAFGTPTGLDAMEVISDTEMKSYGWCYEVDGKLSEVMPGDYKITPKTQSIRWFVGYAHFKNGNWISQCTPAYKSKFICKR